MRLTIFGATGGTGRHLVRQALDAGHEVTAVARTPARVELRHDRLRVVRGDVLEPASIGPALSGAEAVVSAIGPGAGRGPVSIMSAGTRNIIEAMRHAGIRRLVVVSAAPIGEGDGGTLPYRLLARPLLWAVFRNAYQDMDRMEEAVRRSGTDWTIMRPPRLTNGPRRGRYRTAVNAALRRGNVVSRADLADAILRLLDDPDAVKAAIALGY
jgi:putative NADH-flavin reductase